ncbi:MAG: class II aldolase/adducin family protein [Planctomycetota bacterium]
MTPDETSEQELREQVCDVGRRLDERGFVPAMDGNISVRLGDNRFLFTPTKCNLGRMEPDELVVADENGDPEEGDVRPSSEYRLHVACYGRRPDIEAVIHAHPPNCVAASVADIDLKKPILPEVVFTLGAIPTAPYATPASEESCAAMEEYADTYDAVLLDHHGVVTLDENLEGAYMKMEKAENAAEVHLKAQQLGVVRVLPQEEVENLKRLGQKYGLNPAAVPDETAYDSRERG